MSTAMHQTTTRTTRSGTRVVTSSNSSSSLRSATKTPVLRDVKPRVPIPRDSRASPVRPEARHSLQKDPRSRTPVLREPRSKRDLTGAAAAAATAAAAANAANAASIPSAPPTPPPHAATPSTLPVTSISGLRTPSPGPPLDGMLEGRAPLSIFMTNIRLLKLNLVPGFPNITVNTFVPPGPGTQGQKRRIQCAEWVLFHLFSIWDPEETESKLRPFFPPQDPEQSVELRNALFKSLERAKKMGALSRDALVRKSALEDCKADRLEEILASFSTTVLKKVVLEKLANTNTRPDAILSYATQNSFGHRADRSELTAMTLAYRSSIHKMMQQKEAAKTRYRDFTDLLTVKEQDAVRRHKAILDKEIEGTDQPVSDNARAEMLKTLRNNWSGNEAWMDSLFGGESRETGLMASPFDDVWSKLHQDRLAEAETEGPGLLQQLEGRVRLQKERLQKWNAFRRDTFGSSQAEPAGRVKAVRANLKGIDLGFENHMNLQVGKMARLSLKNRGVREPAMTVDYAAIVSGLNQDLARISKKDVNLANLLAAHLPKKQDKPQRRHHRSTSSLGNGDDDDDDEDAASDISDLDAAEKSFPAEFHQPTSFPDRLAGPSCRSSLRPKLSRPDLTSIAVEGSSGPAISLGKLNFPGKSAYDIDQFDIPEPPTPPKEATATMATKPAMTPPSKRRTAPAQTPRDARPPTSPPSKRRTAPSTPSREAGGKPTTPPSKSRKPRRALDTSLNLPSIAVLQDQMTMSPTRYYYADADADADAHDDAHGHGHAHAHARIHVHAAAPSSPPPPPVRRTKPRHTLSVLERKQLSLSRKSSFFLEDDEPDLIHEPASTCGSTAEHTAEEDSKESGGEMTDDHSSLSAPPRHHHHQPQQQKPQPQPQLRRSGRRAMTLPQKPTNYPHFADVAADAEEGGERLLERLTLEQDYEAVFRSRPKIAQNSPVKGYGLSDYYA
ncbi:hypothetical protein ESCO_005307 [Escovopsis weberi]|uniref:HAUS augmin-like complex subunit 6 N-terminal domain-containing protein n=1 Tax=Escovopsis weberi TaxID=150374 RepID=A0A0M8N5P3_ESCWE|nr:hypothetical protein ESCO_005307 [Escovopsis weberi]